jgi:hypothetical protein
MTYPEALQQLAALYAQVPTVACQGHCVDSCGPLGMASLEYHRLRRASPRRLVGKTVACPLLKQGQCTVYKVRPLICRLWGSVESMPCPWGCRPERFLTVEEGDTLMRQVEAVSQALFPGQQPHTMHPPELIEQVQEAGAKAVAWAVLATMEPLV